MRTLTLLFLLTAFQLGAKEVEMKTTITEVTVFQSGAQVKRTGEVMIPAGEHEIKITDATGLLKKESIQVKGEGNFTILSVNPQIILSDVANEKLKWDALEAKQKDLMKQMEDLSVKIQVLNSEETAIANLKDITTTTKGVTVDQISKAEEVVKLKLMQIKTEKLKDSRLILDLLEQHKEVSQHLVALKTPKKSVSYEIIIKVSAKAETKGSFTISYIVPNARWYPTYDLRVKNVSEPMTIEYKANVSQESGEDWNNIKLKLSTGDPSQSSQKPKIEPWWLYLNQNYVQPRQQSNFYRYTDAKFTHVKGVVINSETGEPISWCNVMIPGTNIGTTADEEGNFSLVLPENVTYLSAYAIGYEAQEVSISEENMTIKLQKKEIPVNETVKTDYYNELLTVDAPKFQTEYDGALLTPNVDVAQTYGWAAGQAQMDSSVGYGAMAEQNAVAFTTMNANGASYAYNSVSKEMQDAKQIVATKTLNIVSTEFSIEEKYSIPSSPKNMIVSIQSIETSAKYQYYCAPRLDKDVFITAQLVNWEQYNLLEGQANVFFEGTFVGNTFFDTRYLVDTLEVSLGRDKGIKVDRKKSNDYNKRQVLGNDNTANRSWDITVRNAKQQPIDIIIEDQFPVSADSKIVVTQEEKSDGKLDEKTGIISWPFRLEPSATKSLALKYKVKYPKGNFVGLD